MSNYYTSPSATNVGAAESVQILLHEPLADSFSVSIKDKQIKLTLYLE